MRKEAEKVLLPYHWRTSQIEDEFEEEQGI